MSNETATYRFDDDYDTAYHWNGDAYLCIGNYTKFDIKASMTESQKEAAVDRYMDAQMDGAFE